MRRIVGIADRLMAGLMEGAAWLTLPVAFLLFAQWPLRLVPGGLTRTANDLGQWLFALLIAASITAATRERAHLAADALTRAMPEGARRALWLALCLVALLPWSAFLCWKIAPAVLASVVQLERFAETDNPGYFIVRSAALLLPLLILAQAALDLAQGGSGREPPR